MWVTALALIMACVPSLTTQSIPTVDPGAINTMIIQTANAAATQTAAALPSSTPTPIITPTRSTATPTLTPTSTVIFLFFSPTALKIPSLTNAPASGSFACQVVKTTPANGSQFSPRQDFGTVWEVKNIGKKKWDRTTVNYAYSTGDKIHKISSYDLSKNIQVGGTIELTVDMQAPKDPGTYNTTWTMQSGSRTFCPLTLTIVVRASGNEATATVTP